MVAMNVILECVYELVAKMQYVWNVSSTESLIGLMSHDFFSFQTCKTVCATGALPQPESSESSGEQTDRPCDDLLGFGLLS